MNKKDLFKEEFEPARFDDNFHSDEIDHLFLERKNKHILDSTSEGMSEEQKSSIAYWAWKTSIRDVMREMFGKNGR